MAINLTINGKVIVAREGQTVLAAAAENGITIPTLCHHKDLSPVGSCRLCIVEIKNWRNQVAACNLPATEGMVVSTDTRSLHDSRRQVLRWLLQNYQDTQYWKKDKSSNEFEYWLNAYGISIEKTAYRKPRYPVDQDPNPFVRVDFNKCILCTRCVRACNEIQGRFVWGVSGRGGSTHISAGAGVPMLEARCESCGACVAYCPTGALDNKLSYDLGEPDRKVTTTCAYCGVGCQFDLNIKDERVIRVTSNPIAPVNGMHLCVKGRYGYDFIHHPDRLTQPRVRRYLLEGRKKDFRGQGWEWVETSWDAALDLAAKKLAETRDNFGSQSVGILSSAKCSNEENYLMNKFARQVMGTNNIDHCARLCHSSTVAGLAASFGSGAMSNTMADIVEQAAAILVIGSNTTEQHPVFGAMLRQAVLKRGVKLVIADPRRIDLADFATPAYGGLFLRQHPGTDIALINGLMNIITQNAWEDKDFIRDRTEGYEEFLSNLKAYTPELVSGLTGVPAGYLYQAAELLSKNRPMAVIWAMGITQHIVGVMNVMTLANLQMLLGNMGVKGGGVNPLRGQNNVQGACDMGGLPNVYPGYQNVMSEEARLKFQAAWGATASEKVGMTVTEMIPGCEDGRIRALYIMAEDPIMSDPNTHHVRICLENCGFIVLQEIFPSETSEYADILLPGVSFAEKDGTITNTERRVQLSNRAIKPQGNARPDWEITAEIAKRVIAIGGREILPYPYSGWNYENPGKVMDEIATLTPSYSGISYSRLEEGEQLHWPVKGYEHPGTPILHIGQFTRGKGLFAAINHIPPAELPNDEYPILLSTGRVLYHWHGGEMTRRAKGLMDVYDSALVEVNPEDAADWGIAPGDVLRVISRRGKVDAEAWVTDRVPPGMVFANFHFPITSANILTHEALDPVAKIPEYKISAVRIEKI